MKILNQFQYDTVKLMSIKNNKGYSIVILLVVFLLIGLAYTFSFKQNKVIVEDVLKDTGLIDEEIKNPYAQAIEAAKKVKLLQMRPITEDDYYFGDLDAPVKIIYYSDFECSFCPEYIDDLNKVLENFEGDVVIAFRHFILSNHNFALDAALAFECAVEQDEYEDMYYALYEDNEDGVLGKEEYIRDAEEIGLDLDKFEKCLSEEKYLGKIRTLVNEANSYGVNGTPSTFINGKSFPGAYPYEDFVDQIGKEKKGLKTIIEEELGE